MGTENVLMRIYAAPLAVLALLIAPVAVAAQEVVTVAGVEATRVVIAPPQTELARIIKKGLSEAYFGSQRGTRAYLQAQKLYFFYGGRHFEPRSEERRVGKECRYRCASG